MFFDFLGLGFGILLLILIEYIKRRFRKSPMGELFALYASKYVVVAELGVVLMTFSFLMSATNPDVRAAAAWKISPHHLLMMLAMLTFLFSGKIFLDQLERVIRHKKQAYAFKEKGNQNT